MDFYYVLKTMNPKEMDDFIKKRISKLERDSINDKPILGYYADENPRHCLDLENNKGAVTARCLHRGYIKKGTKVVYGLFIGTDGNVENDGNYYFLNDDKYIYDFCHFIKQFEIYDEFDLFNKILEFIRNYFGKLKKIDRDEMLHIFYDSNGKRLPLRKEHDLNWFKNQGSAMCTEYTVMAQNILSFLGIDSYTIIGAQKVGKEDVESHAFNFVSLPEIEDEEGEVLKADLLIDFSGFCNIYNVKREKIGEAPFIGYIDDFDDNFIHRFIYEEEPLIYQDYNYEKVGNTTLQVLFGRDREYYCTNELIAHRDCVAKEKRR